MNASIQVCSACDSLLYDEFHYHMVSNPLKGIPEHRRTEERPCYECLSIYYCGWDWFDNEILHLTEKWKYFNNPWNPYDSTAVEWQKMIFLNQTNAFIVHYLIRHLYLAYSNLHVYDMLICQKQAISLSCIEVITIPTNQINYSNWLVRIRKPINFQHQMNIRYTNMIMINIKML